MTQRSTQNFNSLAELMYQTLFCPCVQRPQGQRQAYSVVHKSGRMVSVVQEKASPARAPLVLWTFVHFFWGEVLLGQWASNRKLTKMMFQFNFRALQCKMCQKCFIENRESQNSCKKGLICQRYQNLRNILLNLKVPQKVIGFNNLYLYMIGNEYQPAVATLQMFTPQHRHIKLCKNGIKSCVIGSYLIKSWCTFPSLLSVPPYWNPLNKLFKNISLTMSKQPC